MLRELRNSPTASTRRSSATTGWSRRWSLGSRGFPSRCRSSRTMIYAERFPEDVEGTAYFVACESLTNVATPARTTLGSGYRIRADDSASLSKTTVRGSSRTVPVPAGWPTSATASRRCTASSRSKAGWAPEQASVPNYHFTRRPQVRMSDKLRVVIAEDNSPRTEGVRRLLETLGDRGRSLRR